ncbi:uncharacterized protein LOC143365556 [Halictus rubicundus]|uniref:uncharacterized protein LOC143365556 n=1 Tax=Halictus rubicundus TaxID=77578 RepID=UPI0040356A02
MSFDPIQGIAGATGVVNGPSTRSRRRVTMFSGRLVAVTWAGEQSRCDEVIVWFFSGGGSRDVERPNAGCYVESCGGVTLAMCESATYNLSRVASATCPPGRKDRKIRSG